MTTTTKPKPLAHLGDCQGPRSLDVTEHPNGITTRHCVDCGAHEATNAAGTVLPPPVNPGPYNGHPKHERDGGITLTRMENKR